MTKKEFKQLPKYETLDDFLNALKDGTFPKSEDVTIRMDNDSFHTWVDVEGEEDSDDDFDLLADDVGHVMPEELLLAILNDVLGVNAEPV